MERPKRAASKVSDFRRYHLSGNLDKELQGCVGARISQYEMSTPEELQQQLQDAEENSKKMQQDVEAMQIRNKIDLEKHKHLHWQTALEKLKEAREHAAQQNEKVLEKMREVTDTAKTESSNEALQWLQDQIKSIRASTTEPEKAAEHRAKQAALEELKQQQQDLNKRWQELTGEVPESAVNITAGNTPDLSKLQDQKGLEFQELLLQQIKAALTGKKEEEDPNKTLFKALITSQNKALGTGGTSTLRPAILRGLLEDSPNSNTMAEWLATLNKQEEGESEIESNTACRQGKTRSGILERATLNIVQKQVWPQQNLGEDWADEDVEFKQMRFKHMVAGETRTLETCTDPAQILGRLRLLRRMSYLKLRGYE